MHEHRSQAGNLSHRDQTRITNGGAFPKSEITEPVEAVNPSGTQRDIIDSQFRSTSGSISAQGTVHRRQFLQWAPFLLPIILALALRLALFVLTLPTPERFLYAPDSYEYDVLAQNLAAGHGFSISVSPPFVPDLRRTPLYPLLLAFVFRATDHNLAAVILVNVAVSVIAVALTYAVAFRLFGVAAAVGAASIMATDLTSITYSNLLLTEVTFTALLLTGILVLVGYVRNEHPSRATVSGIFLGLSALCRPIGIFLGAATLPVFVGGIRANGIRSRFFAYFLLNVSCLLLVGIWLLRNYLTFGGADFSSVGAVNFYFHRAAAVQALIEGVDELSVRARWEREFASLSGGWSEEQKANWLNGQALELIGQHPVLYTLVYGRGLLRMMEPEQDGLTDLLGWEHGSAAAGLLTGVGWLQLLVVYALAVWGAVMALRNPHQRNGILLLFTFAAYFAVTAGPEAYSRFRVPVMPLISVFAGYGLVTNRVTFGLRPSNA